MLISNEHLGMKAQEWFTDFSFDKIALAGTEREMRDTRANPAKRYRLGGELGGTFRRPRVLGSSRVLCDWSGSLDAGNVPLKPKNGLNGPPACSGL
jgi:hypothetical protein